MSWLGWLKWDIGRREKSSWVWCARLAPLRSLFSLPCATLWEPVHRLYHFNAKNWNSGWTEILKMVRLISIWCTFITRSVTSSWCWSFCTLSIFCLGEINHFVLMLNISKRVAFVNGKCTKFPVPRRTGNFSIGTGQNIAASKTTAILFYHVNSSYFYQLSQT